MFTKRDSVAVLRGEVDHLNRAVAELTSIVREQADQIGLLLAIMDKQSDALMDLSNASTSNTTAMMNLAEGCDALNDRIGTVESIIGGFVHAYGYGQQLERMMELDRLQKLEPEPVGPEATVLHISPIQA